ncbi:MAG TPA: methyltransferase domain-containing protein [Gemmatimonadales bacterium]|nr:methyltransferase domain-containing protein [Gemmatimonadales bacterium]
MHRGGSDPARLPLVPKVRPPLPEGTEKVYQDYYLRNRLGASASGWLSRAMESWLHRRVAADVTDDPSPKATLEIGAGTLNQLPFEPEVGPYDIVEPVAELYEGAALLRRVRRAYRDIHEVPRDARYDRITSVATLEHVCNLPEVLATSALLLTAGGTFRAGIPSEGTPLWRLGWRLTTGLEFRLRHGLDYARLMRHEHVNTAREIEDLLRFFFRRIEMRVFGPARRLSFYQFFACADPDLGRSEAYLARLPQSGRPAP